MRYVKRGSLLTLVVLRREDLIKEVNHSPVHEVKDFNEEVAKLDLQKGVVFLINRSGHHISI